MDELDKITEVLRDLGNGVAATSMGAIEAHGLAIKDAALTIASAIHELAETVENCFG